MDVIQFVEDPSFKDNIAQQNLEDLQKLLIEVQKAIDERASEDERKYLKEKLA